MGFVERYIAYGARRTDAPEDFHRTGAFYLLSCVLGRHVKIPLSIGDIYPNMWLMWVGESSITRKSTAMGYVEEVLNKVIPESLMPERFSPEGLLQEMMEKTEGGVHRFDFIVDEFGGMFEAVHKKDYMSDVKDILMESYDNPPNLTRRTKAISVKIKMPSVNLLAGISSQRFDDVVTLSDAKDGFLARFLLVNPDMKGRVTKPITMFPDELAVEKNNLVNMLKDIDSTVRDWVEPMPIEMTEEALYEYNKFVARMEKNIQDGVYGDVGPLISRLNVYAVKFALLVAISDDPDILTSPKPLIRRTDVIRGISMVENRYLWYSVQRVRELEMSVKARKVFRVINDYSHSIPPENGGVALSGVNEMDILSKVFIQPRDFYSVIEYLEKAGFIIRFTHTVNSKRRAFWKVKRWN